MKTLAITGGGTGGHLVIAKALKEEALKEGFELIYFGSSYGQDRQWFEGDKDFNAAYFFDTRGVVNKRFIGKFLALWAILKAMIKARKLLKQHHVQALISVGGYSAAPASFAAITLRIPFFIHEQNATIGKLNALLKPFSKEFFSSYTPNPSHYPVRDAFFQTKRLRDKVKTVIFLGGSQGAKAINTLALSLASELQKRDIKIIHQCGQANINAMQDAYVKANITATLFAFSDDMPNLIAQADLAIARSGASTVWELTANLLPAVFIPYPYAANDHQAANAQSHVDQEASWMMRENSIDRTEILSLIDGGVKQQSQNLEALLKPQGANKIIKRIETYV